MPPPPLTDILVKYFLNSGEHVLTTGRKKVLPAYYHFKTKQIGEGGMFGISQWNFI